MKQERNVYKLAEWQLGKMSKDIETMINNILHEEKWTETELTGKLQALLAVLASCRVSAGACAQTKEN